MALYEILTIIVGVPANDSQAFALYMVACLTGTMMVFGTFWLFKFIGNMAKSF